MVHSVIGQTYCKIFSYNHIHILNACSYIMVDNRTYGDTVSFTQNDSHYKNPEAWQHSVKYPVCINRWKLGRDTMGRSKLLVYYMNFHI